MNILFITSTRLGDAILSTGLLRYITDTYPHAKITVACGQLGYDIFSAIPQVTKVHVVVKQRFHGHWFTLWQHVRHAQWDMIIDLRNSVVSRVLRAQQKFIFGRQIDRQMHKVQQMAAVMRLSNVPAPKIWLQADVQKNAKLCIPDGAHVLAIGPAANWIGKTWPSENFIALVTQLLAGPCQGWRLAIMAAPNERAMVAPILNAFPNAIDLVGAGSPLLMAACLARTQLFIGNDSGLMHTAAAIGVRTVGLFGPSWPHIYGPYGAHTSYVATDKNFAQLITYPEYTPDTAPCLMTELSVDRVYQHIIDTNAAQTPAAMSTPETAQLK